MKRELVEYVNGDRNVVQDEFVISREKNGTSELIFINSPGIESPMYALWNSRKQAKQHKVKYIKGEVIAEIKKVTPKGTGGEPAYAMLMLTELEKAISKLSMESAGFVLKLVSCLEWNTCRVIRKRDKAPMTIEMMSEQFRVGKVKLKKILSELSALKIMAYDSKNKTYLINRSLIKKGMEL